MTDSSQASPRKPVKIAPPTGTRDFYPREMLVRRYITDAWRRTALRHGFDEIDGPTFESAELYKVKSGEGILSEMFGAYSGKSPDDVEAVKRGEPPFGLRPEFTPTLARMYAARAKQLPQPTKWFCVSNFFRAERPQRGRLREFWQWNCDFIGGEGTAAQLDADAEIASLSIALLHDAGLKLQDCKVHLGDREVVCQLLQQAGVSEASLDRAIRLLDRKAKLSSQAFEEGCSELGLKYDLFVKVTAGLEREVTHRMFSRSEQYAESPVVAGEMTTAFVNMEMIDRLVEGIYQSGGEDWLAIDYSLARGLAYYTGTVFEVIAEGERAVAGGGRYDNLIELFGGPPTPACGFGMGDAVLGNLLEDRKLIPEGRDMLEALARPMPYRPDVFVIASPNEGCEELIVPTVARLRRGEESEKYKQGETKPWSPERYLPGRPPLHARRSYKATKNVGKLLADASACHARFAAIIESPESCTLKNLDSGVEDKAVPLADLASRVPPHA